LTYLSLWLPFYCPVLKTISPPATSSSGTSTQSSKSRQKRPLPATEDNDSEEKGIKKAKASRNGDLESEHSELVACHFYMINTLWLLQV
jgi:hypothetical protein